MVYGFGVRDILISLEISLNKKVYRQLQFHCNVRATPAHLLLISPSELKKETGALPPRDLCSWFNCDSLSRTMLGKWDVN